MLKKHSHQMTTKFMFNFLKKIYQSLFLLGAFFSAATGEMTGHSSQKKEDKKSSTLKTSVSVIISKSLCHYIVISNKSREDVNYKPDHPVPADIAPPQDLGLSDVEIEILLPLGHFVSNARNFSPVTQTAIAESQIHGGKIIVSKDGKLTINNHLVRDEARGHLEKICRSYYPDI